VLEGHRSDSYSCLFVIGWSMPSSKSLICIFLAAYLPPNGVPLQMDNFSGRYHVSKSLGQKKRAR
jgi:hypothetical protein